MINGVHGKELQGQQDLSRGSRMGNQNNANGSKKNNGEESEFLKRFRQMLEIDEKQNADKKLTK